eukprot:TRINITY_DN5317_c0_g1_i6.p1 TRINITY_DN5317_c0_g1~~TRINITY_DN5317_c0_g1_i6.p1  ORF type:complete len:165 (+),score=26.47 TRINITY_DN5317_c0_g1_i6:95-589(+)
MKPQNSKPGSPTSRFAPQLSHDLRDNHNHTLDQTANFGAVHGHKSLLAKSGSLMVHNHSNNDGMLHPIQESKVRSESVLRDDEEIRVFSEISNKQSHISKPPGFDNPFKSQLEVNEDKHSRESQISSKPMLETEKELPEVQEDNLEEAQPNTSNYFDQANLQRI